MRSTCATHGLTPSAPQASLRPDLQHLGVFWHHINRAYETTWPFFLRLSSCCWAAPTAKYSAEKPDIYRAYHYIQLRHIILAGLPFHTCPDALAQGTQLFIAPPSHPALPGPATALDLQRLSPAPPFLACGYAPGALSAPRQRCFTPASWTRDLLLTCRRTASAATSFCVQPAPPAHQLLCLSVWAEVLVEA